MEIRSENLYTKEHEWLAASGAQRKVGITDYAQSELGDIVFVELPEIGKTFKRGEALANIESVKAVSEVYAPVDCEVVSLNSSLEGAPESINSAPFDEGWLIEVKLLSEESLSELMGADAYGKFVEEIS